MPLIVSNIFLKAFPDCPIIHRESQMFKGPKLCFCPCFIHIKPWRDLESITIDHDCVCRGTAMIPNVLMKHLSDQGDPPHKAIYIDVEKLKASQQGSSTLRSAKNSFFDHSIIMTNWQVLGQQQQ
jgi:hypothetical protein